MTADELVGVKGVLAHFAAAEGFTIGTVSWSYESSPAAFEALVHTSGHQQATAVVLPSMLHFVLLGAPLAVKLTFGRATGTHVFVRTPQDVTP